MATAVYGCLDGIELLKIGGLAAADMREKQKGGSHSAMEDNAVHGDSVVVKVFVLECRNEFQGVPEPLGRGLSFETGKPPVYLKKLPFPRQHKLVLLDF